MPHAWPGCLNGLPDEAVAQLAGTRSQEQFDTMLEKLKKNECSFCPQHLDRDSNQVLFENGGEDSGWMVWECPPKFLRKELGVHLLIVPKKHVRFPWHLDTEDFTLEAEVWQFIQDHYQNTIPGGGIITRIGDMRYNAGTVAHLHKNLWVPNMEGEVRAPLFKIDERVEENQQRMARFAENYDERHQHI